MTRLITILSLITCFNLNAQKLNVPYIWKSCGIENDTIVSEIRFLNEVDYIENTYVGDKSNKLSDYKTWPLKIKHGKAIAGDKFIHLTEYNGAEIVKCNFVKIKRNQIRFYNCNSKKRKWVRSKAMTYKLASL